MNESLKKKINAYMVLATGYLAMHAEKSDAQIIYTDINPDTLLNQYNTPYFLDLNNDGVVDFKFFLETKSFVTFYNNGETIDKWTSQTFSVQFKNNSNKAIDDSLLYPSVLNSGNSIGINANWGAGQILFKNIHEHISGPYTHHEIDWASYGNWPNLLTEKYLGLRIKDGSAFNYG